MSQVDMNRTTTEHLDDVAERRNMLFRRVLTGDQLAFRELYEEVSRPIMAYCLSFTRDMDDAKDLFQQTMTAVFEHRHQYRNNNLMAWIFAIARNACRTWERKKRRFSPLDHEPMWDNDVDTVEHTETVSIVQAAILDLPDDFRTVILLRYFGEMSIREISESENISESLVKVRLFRARERLYERLGPLIGPES